MLIKLVKYYITSAIKLLSYYFPLLHFNGKTNIIIIEMKMLCDSNKCFAHSFIFIYLCTLYLYISYLYSFMLCDT